MRLYKHYYTEEPENWMPLTDSLIIHLVNCMEIVKRK